MSESEITKVQLVIRKFLFETRDVVKNPQASMEWLSKFRDTLMYQDCESEPCDYALTLLSEARKFNESQRKNAQTRQAKNALVKEGVDNPTKEQVEAKRVEMYENGDIENYVGNKATTPQPSAISTDGPRQGHTQAENAQAEAGAPSHGGSVANNSALDMPKSDKASDPEASNTGITPPVVSLESGKFEHGDGNTADTASGRGPEPDTFHDQVPDKVSTNNCGADAVNGNATVDRKSSTSAPLRPWKEVVEKSLGISETDKSGTGKGVRPPNPVPGLLKKRRAAGSPLKPGTGPSPAARSLPKSMAEVSDFACSENLDYDDARLWWEQNFVERKGRDKEGKKITNWRGALIRFCASAKRKRESA